MKDITVLIGIDFNVRLLTFCKDVPFEEIDCGGATNGSAALTNVMPGGWPNLWSVSLVDKDATIGRVASFASLTPSRPGGGAGGGASGV